MQVQIPSHVIKAAISTASAKDSRYYLVGVNVRVTDEQMIYIESTDGCVAFQDRLQYLHEGDKGSFSILIPLDAAKRATKDKTPVLTLCDLPDGRYLLGDTVFTAIDGVFPTIDRVMPKKADVKTCDVEQMQFNPELLQKCLDAMRHATQEKKAFFRLQPAQPEQSVGAALMYCRDTDYPRCAIMPLNMRAYS